MTDATGKASLNIDGAGLEVLVLNQEGQPQPGVNVGVTVGNTVIVIAAVDPSGESPVGIAVTPLAQLASFRTSAGADATPSLALLDPITITLLAIGLVGGLDELLSDPIHQQIVVDGGIVKTCTAGDFNDLLAVAGPLIDAGVSTVLSAVSHSKAVVLTAELTLLDVQEVLSWLDVMDQDRLFWCQVLVGDADFSGQLVVLSSVTGGGLLAQDGDVPSVLHFVEPSATGDDLAIGPIWTGAEYPTITDVALWDDIALQNASGTIRHPEVYAVSFDKLYRLNRRTAVAEPIGVLGVGGINALAFNSAGDLYALGHSGVLIQLDPRNGAIVRTVELSPAVQSSGDLQFLPDGRLVGTVTGNGSDRLAQINPLTGAVQFLGEIEFSEVYGLAWFQGTLWGLTHDNDLLRIDVQTGRGTRVRSLSFNANGASVRQGSDNP